MSELSARIADLKGTRPTSEIISAAKVSRQTFRKIELGESVKLSTLRQIADAIGANEQQWAELLAAWLSAEAGGESRLLWIHPRGEAFSESKDSPAARALMLFEQLNAADRQHVLKTMQRKEVLACLPAINRVWEKFSN